MPIVAALTLGGCAATLPSADRKTGSTERGTSVYPLGTLQTTAAVDPKCPPGHTCQGVVVTCPSVAADAPGFVAVAEPTGAPRGVVVFFQGGGGTGWVIEDGEQMALLNQLRAAPGLPKHKGYPK
jgi:hypothetical protein